MKEYSLSIKDMLIGGLRPDERVPRNSGFLEECKNVRVSRFGDISDLSTFTPIDDPFASGYLTGQSITVGHPFPQIFKGREATFLLTQTGMYTVTEGANWTLSQISTYNAYNVTAAKAITSGNSWQFADFGKMYALFNGNCMVFKHYFDSYDSGIGEASNVLVVDDVTINTGCAFRGRMIMGGFDPTDFYNTSWQSFFSANYPSIEISQPGAPGSNFVWWSSIGEGALFLIYAAHETAGIYTDPGESVTVYSTATRNKLYDTINKNQMGFMPMPWQGTVQCVKPMGNGVMVYGDNGITYMPHIKGTFGVKPILPYGICSRNSVCGNDPINPTENVFIDEAGWLHRINEEGDRNLGFREFFEDMVDDGDDVLISYDPIEQEYHISNDALCYVLTKDDKLYESGFLPTGIAVYAGGAVGVCDQAGEDDDEYAVLQSCPIDLGVRGIGIIERVVVVCTNTDKVEVALGWRMKSGDSWSTTPYKVINNEGAAYFPVRGIEFKIIIRVEDYSTFDPDDVVVHFKTADKRLIRGTYTLDNLARR